MVGTGLLLVYSLAQTFAGRARFDTTLFTSGILAAGLGCLAAAFTAIGFGWLTSRRPGGRLKEQDG